MKRVLLTSLAMMGLLLPARATFDLTGQTVGFDPLYPDIDAVLVPCGTAVVGEPLGRQDFTVVPVAEPATWIAGALLLVPFVFTSLRYLRPRPHAA